MNLPRPFALPPQPPAKHYRTSRYATIAAPSTSETVPCSKISAGKIIAGKLDFGCLIASQIHPRSKYHEEVAAKRFGKPVIPKQAATI